jgi:hypothetical protein
MRALPQLGDASRTERLDTKRLGPSSVNCPLWFAVEPPVRGRYPEALGRRALAGVL